MDTIERNQSFRFQLERRKTIELDYEVGETYENYIDIENNNYRIYFFTFDNKLIARFEPDGFVVTEKSDYRDYSVLGKAPAALANHKNFKMVVLANTIERNQSFRFQLERRKTIELPPIGIADIRKQRFSVQIAHKKPGDR